MIRDCRITSPSPSMLHLSALKGLRRSRTPSVPLNPAPPQEGSTALVTNKSVGVPICRPRYGPLNAAAHSLSSSSSQTLQYQAKYNNPYCSTLVSSSTKQADKTGYAPARSNKWDPSLSHLSRSSLAVPPHVSRKPVHHEPPLVMTPRATPDLQMKRNSGSIEHRPRPGWQPHLCEQLIEQLTRLFVK
jgi:hypothetical protein